MNSLKKAPVVPQTLLQNSLARDYTDYNVWVQEFAHQASKLIDPELDFIFQILLSSKSKESAKIDISKAVKSYLENTSLDNKGIKKLKSDFNAAIENAFDATVEELLGDEAGRIMQAKSEELYRILNRKDDADKKALRKAINQNDVTMVSLYKGGAREIFRKEVPEKRYPKKEIHKDVNNAGYVCHFWVRRLSLIMDNPDTYLKRSNKTTPSNPSSSSEKSGVMDLIKQGANHIVRVLNTDLGNLGK